MTAALFTEQLLNGVQFGVILFLIASGLTLVFGIMARSTWPAPSPPP